MNLSPEEVQTLKTLVLRDLGQPVGFVRIADALRLTGAGLAARTSQGWTATTAGRQHLIEDEQAG